MILGFKPQFVRPILSGAKIHTIRVDRGKRWHAGRTIHFATGVRTKNYHCFKTDKCRSTQSFELYCPEFEGEFKLCIDGQRIIDAAIAIKLARNDGFSSILKMVTFFKGGFKGTIIHWTNFRY